MGDTLKRPATDFSFERGMALIQALAQYPNRAALESLAREWACKDECGREIEHLPQGDLIEMLAQYALIDRR